MSLEVFNADTTWTNNDYHHIFTKLCMVELRLCICSFLNIYFLVFGPAASHKFSANSGCEGGKHHWIKHLNPDITNLAHLVFDVHK